MAAALVLGVLTVGGWVPVGGRCRRRCDRDRGGHRRPARQSFVSEIVDAELVSNAVALNSASFNGGRIVGPAVAGLVIARWDTGVAMLLNAASFLVVIAALLALDRSALHPAPPSRGRGGILEGALRPGAARPAARAPPGLRPWHLRDELPDHHRADGQRGVPSGSEGVRAARLGHGRRLLGRRTAQRASPQGADPDLLLALVGFVAASGLAALAPTYPLFALALLPVGLSALTAMTTANALVQLGTEPGMRGRVMACTWRSSGTPVGAPSSAGWGSRGAALDDRGRLAGRRPCPGWGG